MNEIERYANENCRHVLDEFTEYCHKEPFTFLPGHRECIFGIKSEMLKLQYKKKSKKTSKQSALIDEDNIETSLELQISNYVGSKLSNIDWASTIKGFKVTKSDSSVCANCTFVCPVDKCDSVINVKYVNHWIPSNVFRHLRSHFNSDSNNTQENSNHCQKNVTSQSSNGRHETVYVLVSNDETTDGALLGDLEIQTIQPGDEDVLINDADNFLLNVSVIDTEEPGETEIEI